MSTYVEQRLPRVVVVGAGMAGLAAVRALAGAPVSVLLIDAHNYTTFPPLLFQVAICFISPDEVARPVRAQLRRQKNVEFRLGRVSAVDCAAKRLLMDDGGEVPFDYLVLAAGVTAAFANVPGAARHAIPLKSVNDATRLRNSLLRSFETAAAHPTRSSPADTSIVVVGGGPSGVEVSGYVANFLFHHQFTADYPQLDPTAMRVTLIERGSRLLAGFHPRLSRYALDTLRSRGVDIRLDTDVVEVDADGVTISGGERIPAATIVWAGGVGAPAWVESSRLALDCGRLVVEPDLRLPGHPDMFVVETSRQSPPGRAAFIRSSLRSLSRPDVTPAGRFAASGPVDLRPASPISTRARWRSSGATPRSCRRVGCASLAGWPGSGGACCI